MPSRPEKEKNTTPPYFSNSTRLRVIGQVGTPVYLTCHVHNLADRAVSIPHATYPCHVPRGQPGGEFAIRLAISKALALECVNFRVMHWYTSLCNQLLPVAFAFGMLNTTDLCIFDVMFSRRTIQELS